MPQKLHYDSLEGGIIFEKYFDVGWLCYLSDCHCWTCLGLGLENYSKGQVLVVRSSQTSYKENAKCLTVLNMPLYVLTAQNPVDNRSQDLPGSVLESAPEKGKSGGDVDSTNCEVMPRFGMLLQCWIPKCNGSSHHPTLTDNCLTS